MHICLYVSACMSECEPRLYQWVGIYMCVYVYVHIPVYASLCDVIRYKTSPRPFQILELGLTDAS